jgi:hypothetical protein
MMTIWDVLSELISNTNLPQRVKEKISGMGLVLFRETYELNDRLKLIVIVTAATLSRFTDCEDAYLSYAEMKEMDSSFLKALIDSLKDLSSFSASEAAVVKVATEVSRYSILSDETLKYAHTHFTEQEVEYIVFLTSFINFVAKMQSLK